MLKVQNSIKCQVSKVLETEFSISYTLNSYVTQLCHRSSMVAHIKLPKPLHRNSWFCNPVAPSMHWCFVPFNHVFSKWYCNHNRRNIQTTKAPHESPEKDTSLFTSTFIHSFIMAISIAPLQVRYYWEVLPTQHGYCAGVSHRSTTGNYELRTCPRSLRGGYSRIRTRDPLVERLRLYQCATMSNKVLSEKPKGQWREEPEADDGWQWNKMLNCKHLPPWSKFHKSMLVNIPHSCNTSRNMCT